jgi:hypothetical protein
MIKLEKIVLNIYCDEIKEQRLKIKYTDKFEHWTYIGMLIVPDEISDNLNNDINQLRCLNDKVWRCCDNLCPFHSRNNTEIHYQGVDDSIKFKIAQRWVDYWLNDRKNIYFYILGLNLSKLDIDKFGPRSQQDIHSTIYNRFFRTALTKSLKYFFLDYESIIIKDIYHDIGNTQHHKYFPWHSIYKIQSEDSKIQFLNDNIIFIDSDHRKSEGSPYHSHFIQFIDIILGCFMNCLHLSSTNENKYTLSSSSYDLVSRIIRNPKNANSRYNYYRRQMIEFFPKEDLRGMDESSLEYRYKKFNQFYHERALNIEPKITGQISVFDL